MGNPLHRLLLIFTKFSQLRDFFSHLFARLSFESEVRMESTEPMETTQIWGVIWSFIVVYGLWIALFMFFILVFFGVLFSSRRRTVADVKREQKEELSRH